MSQGEILPGQPDLSQTPRKRRNFLNCRQCRRDKQRCEPSNRDWIKGEKCKRCVDMGYECSAPERAPPKERKRRSTTITTSPPFQNTHQAGASEQARSVSGFAWPPVASSFAVREDIHRSRPLVTAFDNPHIFSTEPSNPAQYAVEEDLYSSRKDTENRARKVLAKLGDQNATKELLQFHIDLCDKVDHLLGASEGTTRIRLALSAAMAILKTLFNTTWEDATDLARKDLGQAKESILSQLLLIKQKFRCAAKDADHEDDGIIEEMLCNHQKRKSDSSIADHICDGALNPLVARRELHSNTEADLVASFTKAGEDIGRVLSDLAVDLDLDHRDLLFGAIGVHLGHRQGSFPVLAFPPCHLAARYATAAVILGLWKKSETPLWKPGILCLTPVHVATYAGMTQRLKAVFEQRRGMASVGPDLFGLTPLLIAAVTDDVSAFRLLLEHGADIHAAVDPDGRNSLVLAARNGCKKVVHFILNSGCLPPPIFASELWEAVQADHREVAQLLTAYYTARMLPWDDHSIVLDGCQEAAMRKGWMDVAAQLQNMKMSSQELFQAASETLTSMAWEEHLDFHTGIQLATNAFNSGQSFANFPHQTHVQSPQPSAFTPGTFSEVEGDTISPCQSLISAGSSRTQPWFLPHQPG